MPPNRYDIFRQDMIDAGFQIEECPDQGPEAWMGLRVRASGEWELQAIQEATRVPLAWENLGKSGYLVYPA